MSYMRVPIKDIMYKETESDLDRSLFVYRDLVHTIKELGSYSIKPVVDSALNLVKNSFILDAFKHAGIDEVTVEVTDDENYGCLGPEEKEYKTLVFFNQPKFNSSTLDRLFNIYLKQCKERLHNYSEKPNELETIQYQVIEEQILFYLMSGNVFQDNSCFEEPNKKLISSLEEEVGKIRSINGLKKLF
ncbi:hypothetical protein KY321_01905 [Candidatus Woesearchaeota archaeon]|nr:hypothetical protein [Candidatus Woesearchaeota archaeon]